ncbi:MAG: DUF6768 family protein [Hyphomonadaceae bacterium]
MSDLDKMIQATLNEEDRTFLARLEREPGYFSQVGGLLTDSLGWLNLLLMIVQAVLFFAGAWCAWEFFQATDTLLVLRWGLTATVLLLTATVLKIATLWPSLQANRVLREIKRLELQIARKADKS